MKRLALLALPCGCREIFGIFAKSDAADTGGTVVYALRTGDAATLGSQAFVEAPLGTPVDGVTGDVLQYGVVMSSDGWSFPTVTLVSVVFE